VAFGRKTARVPRPRLDKCDGVPAASDQIDIAFGSARHVVSRHKNVSLPPQQYADISPRTPRCFASVFASANDSTSRGKPLRAPQFTTSKMSLATTGAELLPRVRQ
jgi:hypothetical protein